MNSTQQQHHEEEAGNKFGDNLNVLNVNIQTVIKNLNCAIDVKDIDSQRYLNHVRGDIDIDAQIQVLRAIGD